jgi:hypothetical protein
VLRGLLYTGGADRYLRHSLAGGDGEGDVAAQPLWWPPAKVAGRYLAPYLFRRDAERFTPRRPVDFHTEGELGRAILTGRPSFSRHG